MKNILLISGSNRKGYSEMILEKVYNNIEKSEIIKLRDYNLKYCIGCLWCNSNKGCILKDDFELLVDKILKADLVVFAIPNFFGGMSGFFKNFIDRFHYMYKKEIIDNKKIVFIYTGAGDENLTMKEMTDATSHIEKYLKLDVINRYSFSSRKELKESHIKSISDFIDNFQNNN